MKVAVLSDMHIQENESASNFKHTDSELLKIFEHAHDNYDVVYLVGDIIECQQTLGYPTIRQQHDMLSATVEKYKKSFDFISSKPEKFKYLSGNHDSVMHEGDETLIPEQLKKIYIGRETQIVTDAGIIDIKHGEERYEYDTVLKYFFWMGTWLGGLYERVFGKNIPTRLTSNTYPQKEFKDCCRENPKIIAGIRGHNHTPETYSVSIDSITRVYLNAGFSDKDAINIGELDTETLQTAIRSYSIDYFRDS